MMIETPESLMAGTRLGLNPPRMRDLVNKSKMPGMFRVEFPGDAWSGLGLQPVQVRPEKSYPWYEATGSVQPEEAFGWV